MSLSKALLAGLVLVLLMGACQTETPPGNPRLTPVTIAGGGATVRITPTVTPDPAAALPSCSADMVARYQSELTPYTPTEGIFISTSGRYLMQGDWRFVVRGLNYYPAAYPLWQFLQVDNDTLETDLALITGLGINTIRIFVSYDALFICPGNGAVPRADGFERLDTVIKAAARYNLRLIVTLHDQPEVSPLSLYEHQDVFIERTKFLVERYQAEPAILAWDIRDAADADYQGGVIGGIPRTPQAERPVVLDWLTRMVSAIRSVDSRHLITASWNQEPEITIPVVDIVSFQLWEGVDVLSNLVGLLREETNKPLLVTALSYTGESDDSSERAVTLRRSLQLIEQAIRADDLVGWIVWNAFDFVPGSACEPVPCQENDPRHTAGIWSVERTPEPAVEVIRLYSQPYEVLSATETPVVTATPEPD